MVHQFDLKFLAMADEGQARDYKQVLVAAEDEGMKPSNEEKSKLNEQI